MKKILFKLLLLLTIASCTAQSNVSTNINWTGTQLETGRFMVKDTTAYLVRGSDTLRISIVDGYASFVCNCDSFHFSPALPSSGGGGSTAWGSPISGGVAHANQIFYLSPEGLLYSDAGHTIDSVTGTWILAGGDANGNSVAFGGNTEQQSLTVANGNAGGSLYMDTTLFRWNWNNGAGDSSATLYLGRQGPGRTGISFGFSGGTILTFPLDDGDPGEALITDGSGNLSWQAGGGGATWGSPISGGSSHPHQLLYLSPEGLLYSDGNHTIDSSNGSMGITATDADNNTGSIITTPAYITLQSNAPNSSYTSTINIDSGTIGFFLSSGNEKFKIFSSSNADSLITSANGSTYTISSNLPVLISKGAILSQDTIFTPLTTETMTANRGHYNIVNPAGTIAALTIETPASPADGDFFELKFTQVVTTITWSVPGGGSVGNSVLTTAGVGSYMKLVYHAGDTTWY